MTGRLSPKRQRAGGVGVAQVVQAHVVEAGAGAHLAPGLEQAGEPGAGLGAGDHPGVAGQALDRRQHLRRLGRERDRARAGLAVAQMQLLRLQAHVLPAQRQDLVAPAAGQHQQAQRRRRVRGEAPGRLELVQGPTLGGGTPHP